MLFGRWSLFIVFKILQDPTLENCICSISFMYKQARHRVITYPSVSQLPLNLAKYNFIGYTYIFAVQEFKCAIIDIEQCTQNLEIQDSGSKPGNTYNSACMIAAIFQRLLHIFKVQEFN